MIFGLIFFCVTLTIFVCRGYSTHEESKKELTWIENFVLLGDYASHAAIYLKSGYVLGSLDFSDSLHYEHVAKLHCNTSAPRFLFPVPYLYSVRLAYITDFEFSLYWEEKISETRMISFRNEIASLKSLIRLFSTFAYDEWNSEHRTRLQEFLSAAQGVLGILENELSMSCAYLIRDNNLDAMMENFDNRVKRNTNTLDPTVATIIEEHNRKYIRPYIQASILRLIELDHTCLCIHKSSMQCIDVEKSAESPEITTEVVHLLDSDQEHFLKKYFIVHREKSTSFPQPAVLIVVRAIDVSPPPLARSSAVTAHVGGEQLMFLLPVEVTPTIEWLRTQQAGGSFTVSKLDCTPKLRSFDSISGSSSSSDSALSSTKTGYPRDIAKYVNILTYDLQVNVEVSESSSVRERIGSSDARGGDDWDRDTAGHDRDTAGHESRDDLSLSYECAIDHTSASHYIGMLAAAMVFSSADTGPSLPFTLSSPISASVGAHGHAAVYPSAYRKYPQEVDLTSFDYCPAGAVVAAATTTATAGADANTATATRVSLVAEGSSTKGEVTLVGDVNMPTPPTSISAEISAGGGAVNIQAVQHTRTSLFAPPRMLLLGLGGGQLQSYLLRRHSCLTLHTIEISSEIALAAHKWFGFHACEIDGNVSSAATEEMLSSSSAQSPSNSRVNLKDDKYDDKDYRGTLNCRSKLTIGDGWAVIDQLAEQVTRLSLTKITTSKLSTANEFEHDQQHKQQQKQKQHRTVAYNVNVAGDNREAGFDDNNQLYNSNAYYHFIIVDVFDTSPISWTGEIGVGHSNPRVERVLASLPSVKTLLDPHNGLLLFHVHEDALYGSYLQGITASFKYVIVLAVATNDNLILASNSPLTGVDTWGSGMSSAEEGSSSSSSSGGGDDTSSTNSREKHNINDGTIRDRHSASAPTEAFINKCRQWRANPELLQAASEQYGRTHDYSQLIRWSIVAALKDCHEL